MSLVFTYIIFNLFIFLYDMKLYLPSRLYVLQEIWPEMQVRNNWNQFVAYVKCYGRMIIGQYVRKATSACISKYWYQLKCVEFSFTIGLDTRTPSRSLPAHVLYFCTNGIFHDKNQKGHLHLPENSLVIYFFSSFVLYYSINYYHRCLIPNI